jgi:hypothetical protein
MDKFEDKVVADFLRRSYFAVDGLWFVRAEAERSFEDALKLDEQVWHVMPKIQARKARELLGVDGDGIKDLVRCFELKLAAEGYGYEVRWPSENEAEIVILACPWYSVLQSAGRESIATAISNTICTGELEGWAKEFSEGIEFGLEDRICTGGHKCLFRFRE